MEPVWSDVRRGDPEATRSSFIVFPMAMAPRRGLREDQRRDALSLARGYLVSLLENEEVSRYLAQNHSEILNEFRRISEVVSMGPEEKV